MADNSKPCPFCGGAYKDVLQHPNTCYLRLVYDNFEANRTNNPSLQHTAEAMETAWNRRYTPPLEPVEYIDYCDI